MTEARKVANHMDNYKDKAFAYEETVRPYLESIRDRTFCYKLPHVIGFSAKNMFDAWH